MKHRLFLYSGLLLTLLSMGGYGGDSLAASLVRFDNPYDGVGSAARFSTPNGVATDGAGNVYVADTSNNTIRKITPAGVVTTFLGTTGVTVSANRAEVATRFNLPNFSSPNGVAIDSAGNVYVTDANNTILKITLAGVVTTLAGKAGIVGSVDGNGAAARFNGLGGVATDSAGNVYVTDTNNDTIRKITSAGMVSTLAGKAGMSTTPFPRKAGVIIVDGTGAAARFDMPSGVATDSAGNVYVADTNMAAIRKITPAGVVTTLAGTAGDSGSADGTGAAASFGSPRGVATDSAGNVYVTDDINTIRKITPAGVVTTLAGTAGDGGSADGTGAAASFNHPSGIATDSAGNVYVADSCNRTIRKITRAGVVTTLAGKPDPIPC